MQVLFSKFNTHSSTGFYTYTQIVQSHINTTSTTTLFFLFANDDFTTVESLHQAIIGSISCVYFLAQV